MPVTIRRATINDILSMQNANLQNLPENYTIKYYMYHILSWPELSFVATTTDMGKDKLCCDDSDADVNDDQLEMELESNDKTVGDRIVKLNPSYITPGEKLIGYVLVKMNDELDQQNEPPNGHITSLSVMRTYRRMGIAEKLMRHALLALFEVHQAEYVLLHVRKSNRAALHLYRDTLSFDVLNIEKSYYQDGENAYAMKKVLKLEELTPSKVTPVSEEGKDNIQLEDDLESDLLEDILKQGINDIVV